MEVAGEGDPNPPPEDWKKTPDAAAGGADSKAPKRKMKSPFQLEVLEQTYAVETYPSEALRAELSAKIGLSDRQLQMWFCHRRLKDRKYPPPAKKAKNEETPPTPPPPPLPLPPVTTVHVPVLPASDVMMGTSFGGSSGGESRKSAARAARVEASCSAGRRYYDTMPPPGMMAPPMPVPLTPQLSMAELRVIASVEAQLGEPLREEGPILGVEFEPLPPGAFGAPIAMAPQQKHPIRPHSGKLYDRHDAKSTKTSAILPSEHCFLPSSSSGKRKSAVGAAHVLNAHAGSRAPHEYQFLPEQPSIRAETYDRLPQSHYYEPPAVAPNSRVSSLPAGGQYLHGNEQVLPAYTFQGQMSSTSILSQGRQQMLSPGPTEYENVTNTLVDTQFGVHQVVGSENPYISSDRRIFRDEDASRVEKKRKTEEARIAKEVETHEKRIRKELEKQDIMRRKQEEQMRREMERLDRERKKEEERLMREKLREEERFQREQRREIERKEKFLQKETLRAEKMRQKEELRREREAARQKAANERATARRIAREYMELVEDERLELMELAASNKGLSSIVSLDSETMEQLDMFRDMLSAFPPKSVQLKRPFAIYPWIQSEENIANLFMVWKFLFTFADVLELWPLTLDEFLQSLHDYDSKLLGEIHVSLLKSIIKDIEDVARTPAFGLGANQNSAANPGGGHPQIVEGAFAWGFDICSWQRHLNFLTWPEILRQFAISAGFGPQLKKRNVERADYHDDNEGNDGKDVISTLRNGAAAESAVALMHEKGYSHRRRSRHRLTPGTVKFAAFHVLSLEGSSGLTILDVAEKIQKSGLRDLTTSKTPEASIAAALSRDTKLFERTAPSTYCVRSAYRKDPADADAILSAAREKMQVFQNGLSDSEEAEKDVEEADDVERDEDSECDGGDDPEVDDINTDTKSNKILYACESKDVRPSPSVDYEKGKVLFDTVGVTPSSGNNADKRFSVFPSGNSSVTSVLGTPQSLEMSQNCKGISAAEVEGAEIDDNNHGEPWVQSLMNGDYSELSTKERLDALVALIDVAIEGNSIRVILEERLEAASALKKQMWADAQLDKRRFKEDFISKLQCSFVGPKTEVSQTNVAIEGSQTPPDLMDNKGPDGNPIDNSDQFLDPQFQIHINNMSAERTPLGQDFPINADSTPLQQYAYAAEKSRAQLKSYIGHKAEQLHVYRSLPLGQDRRRNRYWMFSTSSSPNDIGSGRIFFESKDGFWRLIDSEEAFDSLLSALDTRGVRESHLHSMLQRIESNFKEAIRRNEKRTNSTYPDESLVKTEILDKPSSSGFHMEVDSPTSTVCGVSSDTPEYSSSFKIELGKSERERSAALKRYQIFIKWIWKECYNPSILCAMKYGKKRCSELLQTCPLCYDCYFVEERHCPSCHKTFKVVHNVDAIFSDHVSICELKRKMNPNSINQVSDSPVPMGIQLLKALLSLIEVSVPTEALQTFWTDGYRKSWGVKLHSSSSAEDILQLVTLLECAIKEDFLSSNYETTSELLGSSKAGFLVEEISSGSGSVPVLPWVADSTAAVALRLLDLDASISYMLHQKLELDKEKETNNFIKLPTRFTIDKNIRELDSAEFTDQVDYQREVRWLDPGSRRRGRGRGSRGRGGRGRGRGGRGSRMIGSSSGADFQEEDFGNYQKTTRKYTRGRTRGRGRKRGRRTVRPRPRSESLVAAAKEPRVGSFSNFGVTIKQDFIDDSPRSSGGNGWGLDQTTGTPYVEDEDNSVASPSDDENGLVSAEEYDDQAADYAVGYGHNQPVGQMDDETEEEDEDDDDEDEGGGAHIGRREMDAYVDDEDEEEMGDDDREEDIGSRGGNADDDDFSSEYSDD
ncbi:homeobox-DDT domain protein RLT2 isoform X2 [Iris pallida]|uniref:Homeobox-DDT domain protein RLT2 isoform X2 n=2 Tax=Iris pallida TaxID=29817 RepID=A0AAX6ICL0_IRIPA|nr:homeobox-DDT domain protein RLT2 isoform X2 [Iris pallida]